MYRNVALVLLDISVLQMPSELFDILAAIYSETISHGMETLGFS